MSIKSFIDDLEKEIPMYPPLSEERLARIEKLPGKKLYRVSVKNIFNTEDSTGSKYIEEKVFDINELEKFLQQHYALKV